MQRSYLLLVFLFFQIPSYSQLQETFSDGNFTSDPFWEGETDFFSISSGMELQSNGPNASSQLYLSTPNTLGLNTEWNFYARLDFDITTSNWARIYLTSDLSNTKNALKGYYVKFEGTSNSVDLYRQDGPTHTRLIAGKTGRAGKTTSNSFRIKVIWDLLGNWHLYSDTTASGEHFQKEGTASDSLFTSSAYCGVFFTHSATRRALFYFDDFTIAGASLCLLTVQPKSAYSLELLFNKNLDPFSATQTENYRFLSPSLSILSVDFDPFVKNKVLLHLSTPLSAFTSYSISTTVSDETLREISMLHTLSFHYRPATSYGDLLLTELLPDPSPSIGLPVEEYAELYNNTSDTLDLLHFTLSDESSTAVFPSYLIPPHQYVLLCAQSKVSSFSEFSPVLGLSNFPSLNNNHDKIMLKNQNGLLLHQVSYSDLWYGDNDKKQGGWSLEMIDLNNPCGGETNWTASVDPSGGTPTRKNSVAAHKPDLTPPQLIRASITDSLSIELFFDEAPDTTTLTPAQFHLDQNNSLSGILPADNKIMLVFARPFTPGELHTMTISWIRDCNGNTMPPIQVGLVRPQESIPGDLLINEVLFNPWPGGVDFVELYNHSDKYIDLKNWQFANYSNNTVSNLKPISLESFILKPGEYAAFTKNKSILVNHYPFCIQERIFQLPDLPSYNDTEGTVILLNNQNQVQDRFEYSENFHFAMLDDKEGISLERISPYEITNNPDNWQSASSQSGYATPGYRNSQNTETEGHSLVWVEPQVFTPDQNGDKDFTLIHYRFESPGNVVNITIFDVYGREILRLARNELLATEGFYRWDGNNPLHQKVRSGIYIVCFELFNLQGETKKINKTVVVG